MLLLGISTSSPLILAMFPAGLDLVDPPINELCVIGFIKGSDESNLQFNSLRFGILRFGGPFAFGGRQ